MGTWLVGTFVLLIMGLAVRKLYTDHKRGNTCVGCNATNCPKSIK